MRYVLSHITNVHVQTFQKPRQLTHRFVALLNNAYELLEITESNLECAQNLRSEHAVYSQKAAEVILRGNNALDELQRDLDNYKTARVDMVGQIWLVWYVLTFPLLCLHCRISNQSMYLTGRPMVPYSGHLCQEDPGVREHQNGQYELIQIRAIDQDERFLPCIPQRHSETTGTGRLTVALYTSPSPWSKCHVLSTFPSSIGQELYNRCY